MRAHDDYIVIIDTMISLVRNLSASQEYRSDQYIATYADKFDIKDPSEKTVVTNNSNKGYCVMRSMLDGTQMLHSKSGPAISDNNGYESWYQYGVVHRIGGPALITKESKVYFNKGRIHRENGPAVEACIHETGVKYSCWFKDGKAHRDGDLPCLEFEDGTKVYMQNGYIHRADGPAITLYGDVEIWAQYGRIHREGAPAVIDGAKQLHYKDGKAVDRPVIRSFKTKNPSDADQKISVAKVMADRLGGNIIQCDDKSYCIEDLSGNRTWYGAGTTTKHRDGAPAVELANGTQIYYHEGVIHRDNGPAILNSNGDERCYFHGQLHSPNSSTPAIKLSSGTEFYFKHGVWHRDGDLPAAKLMEESGTHSLIWARDGKLHRDDLSQAAIQWGPDERFEGVTISYLKSIPSLAGVTDLNTNAYRYSAKPTNKYEYYRHGAKIAEAPHNNSETVRTHILSLGDLVISATGTAKISGELSQVGLVNAEITGGTLSLRSTRDLIIRGCLIKDAKIFIEMGSGRQSIIDNNYLINSEIFVTNPNSSYNILNNKSGIIDTTDKMGDSVFYRPDHDDEIVLQNPGAKVRRIFDEPAPALEGPLFTSDEVKQGLKQLELQFGEEHLSPEERVKKVSDILKENLRNYIGNASNNGEQIDRIHAEIARAERAEAEVLLWNLGGCETYALGHALDQEPAPERARPALLAVPDLARRYQSRQQDYEAACVSMHAAAVGEVRGATIGVVEDVAALKASCDQALVANAELRAALVAVMPIAFPVTGGADGCGTVGGSRADVLRQAQSTLTDGVMDVSLTLPLVDRELHYVRVDIDLNDRKQQDEDSVSWKTAFGAIGAAALISYIAGKPKHSDRKHDVVSTQEVVNATL